jgi:PIN domain nuclease of toxin-antitoxin system
MRALLDTHSLIWFLEGDERLSSPARELIEDGDNAILASIVSLWEIAIKHSMGKLELRRPFAELFPAELEQNAIEVLGVEFLDVARVVTLPFHHRDPFDRLLVAQALEKDLPVVGVDAVFDAYGVERIW